MTSSVNTVKCVDVVPGSSRYCGAINFSYSVADVESSLLSTVVVPYEEMGVAYDRIVKVNSFSCIISGKMSSGLSVVADVECGTFTGEGVASERVGKYVLPFDQGHVQFDGPFGAVVVHEGYVFGVKVSLTKLSAGTPEEFTGNVVVNFDFSLVGHPL